MANRTTLADPERTRHRLEIMNLAFKGLLAIHGGGAVALLAFLQAVINTNPALAKIVLAGISCLGLGLVMAVIFMTFRYHTSLEDQRQSVNWRVYRTVSFLCLYGSLAMFLVAVVVLVIGTYRSLPVAP